MKRLVRSAATIGKTEGYRELLSRGVRYASYELALSAMRVRNPFWNAMHGRGTSVLEYDWDNLVLLDACRYDAFVDLSPFPEGRVERRVATGSKTPEFLRRTFADRTLHDTVYVTANPQVLKFEAENDRGTPTFHSIVSLLDEWDGDVQTVPPEAVRRRATRVAEEYPNKRLIVHFVQPHTPFLGETAAEIRGRTGKTIGGLDPGRDYTDADPAEIETASYHRVTRADGVDRETVVEAYRETLGIALESVERLADDLEGKTAITSDHGEFLGERYAPTFLPQWGHPKGLRTTELCAVPWVDLPSEGRKEVTPESPEALQFEDRKTIDGRLRALGYR